MKKKVNEEEILSAISIANSTTSINIPETALIAYCAQQCTSVYCSVMHFLGNRSFINVKVCFANCILGQISRKLRGFCNFPKNSTFLLKPILYALQKLTK